MPCCRATAWLSIIKHSIWCSLVVHKLCLEDKYSLWCHIKTTGLSFHIEKYQHLCLCKLGHFFHSLLLDSFKLGRPIGSAMAIGQKTVFHCAPRMKPSLSHIFSNCLWLVFYIEAKSRKSLLTILLEHKSFWNLKSIRARGLIVGESSGQGACNICLLFGSGEYSTQIDKYEPTAEAQIMGPVATAFWYSRESCWDYTKTTPELKGGVTCYSFIAFE